MPELDEVEVDGASADNADCFLRSRDNGDATAEDKVFGDSPLE